MMDIELYGGKRGFIEHIRARAFYALGVYGNVGDIEWSNVKRLVFVCKGNICRSPYASVRARSQGISAVSFGLDAAQGALADPVASKNALLRGIDLSAHRSERMEITRLADGDWVIVFEPAQLEAFRRRVGEKIPANLLGIWSRPPRPHIEDPYGRSDRYFQQCFSVIDANIAELIEHMRRYGSPAVSDLPTEIPQGSMAQSGPCERTLV